MSAGETDGLASELARLVPNLRAFARSLCGSTDQADDLVQETLVKAWNNRSTFEPGTNLKGWLFTILRNTHLSERRKRKWELQDVDGESAGQLGVRGDQQGHMDLIDFQKAFSKLSADQKEALLLIGAEGFSYEEAAAMCDCAVGTMKSRVNRARIRLSETLGYDGTSYDVHDPHLIRATTRP